MNKNLSEALGEFYTEHVLRGRPVGVAAQKLKQVLANDAEAKEEAQSRLTELNALAASCGDLSKRCFVSSVQRNGLEYALDSVPLEQDINLSEYAKQQAENEYQCLKKMKI